MLSIYYKTLVLCKGLFVVETQFSMKKVSIFSHFGVYPQGMSLEPYFWCFDI
jgi:hypothetical protein